MASADLMRAWARILRTAQGLRAAVEADLAANGAPPLEWYDVLLELDRAANGRLSPKELEGAVLIVQYNLSRLLDRMAREGLIRLAAHPDDGRRQLIEITAKGRACRSDTWPVYAKSVQRHAGGKLTQKEVLQLFKLLGKLAPLANPYRS